MKTLLLSTLLFFSVVLVAPAQDKPSSDVLIPLPVATFFLEQNEKAKILQAQVDTLHQDVAVLTKLDLVRKQQLATDSLKQLTYDSLVNLQHSEIEACRKAEARLSKDLKRQKFFTKMAVYGTAGIAVILIALFD